MKCLGETHVVFEPRIPECDFALDPKGWEMQGIETS